MPADIAELIGSYLPDGWSLRQIGLSEGVWQVLACDEGLYTAKGSGGSVEEALTLCAEAILEGRTGGRLWDGVFDRRALTEQRVDLASLIAKPEPIKLRRI